MCNLIIIHLSHIHHTARQWTFQTCNEFGFYQTPISKVFSYRFPLKFYVDQCSDIFGSSFNATSLNRAVRRTNRIYGGLHPNTTNVFTVQGSMDPWNTLGLHSSHDGRNMPTVLLNGIVNKYTWYLVFIIFPHLLAGCSHCSDVYEPRESDERQIKMVRLKISKWIGEMLHQR